MGTPNPSIVQGSTVFFFLHLDYVISLPLAPTVSGEKSTVILWRIAYTWGSLSLAAFTVPPLSLSSDSVTMRYVGVALQFILLGVC